MALEDPGENEMPQRTMGPPGDLEHEHDLFDVLVAQRRHRAPAVMIDRKARHLARPPEGVVDPRIERLETRTGRGPRQEDAGGQQGGVGMKSA